MPIHYEKNSSWSYTLTEDYTIKVANIDFGEFKAYSSRGSDKGQLLIEGHKDTLIIHKGYSWDGCTGVPSYSWNLEASLVHDALYQTKKCPGGDACKAKWWQVDRLFLVMMKNSGATWIERNTYYAGVRTFGFFFKFNHLYSLVVEDCSK